MNNQNSENSGRRLTNCQIRKERMIRMTASLIWGMAKDSFRRRIDVTDLHNQLVESLKSRWGDANGSGVTDPYGASDTWIWTGLVRRLSATYSAKIDRAEGRPITRYSELELVDITLSKNLQVVKSIGITALTDAVSSGNIDWERFEPMFWDHMFQNEPPGVNMLSRFAEEFKLHVVGKAGALRPEHRRTARMQKYITRLAEKTENAKIPLELSLGGVISDPARFLVNMGVELDQIRRAHTEKRPVCVVATAYIDDKQKDRREVLENAKNRVILRFDPPAEIIADPSAV